MATTTLTTPILSATERASADAMMKRSTVYTGAVGTKIEGLIWNSHKDNKNLDMHEKHDWSKNGITFYPFRMLPSQTAQPNYIGHQALLPVGAKGAVVYTDAKAPSTPPRMWLVAFDCVRNQVYVETGPLGPTDWNNVEAKLNQSGSTSQYVDTVLQGKAQAELRPSVNNTSILYVRFI